MSDPEPVASADAEALDDLRAAWTEGVEEGPWFPAHRPGGPIVLDNKNGDSLFVSAEDATTLVNAFLNVPLFGDEAEAYALAVARRDPEPTPFSSTSATHYLRDALDHWLRNGSSIEAADDLRTAAAEWLRDIEDGNDE